ncbi:aldehyde dehydrogenase family protein [Altererythrobacter marinus]|uniref:Aldehyde dehydrogenase family protein n=1 Tax=Pelagerythrobacter marinus TaxID=538382 RepID=A0ABW9UXY8_9SPHN|nr:aldehyde dehydrogenase family protein [Pelagerythrobacter marinus]MXO69460.1 aldehyde dehydrogenase family protein [Pelagerythrobacter marinus]
MTLQVRNPRTGQFDYSIEPAGREALEAAAGALREAQVRWAARTPEDRASILHRWADAIERDQAAIAAALTVDTGRSTISGIEASAMVQLVRRWADRAPALIAEHQRGGCATSHATITTSTTLVPFPLVGVISPWNFPLTLSLIDAVPALAAGCAALVKPSEVTPRFVAPLVEATRSVPEIAEVLAFVQGDGATGAALVDVVDFVCFTGSVPTGRKVAEAAARAFIPASLELGGKDPMIVLASADPERAAAIALRASIVNTGQACQSIERVYVARAIAEPFLKALVAGAEAVRLNHPDISDGDIGPFIFEKQARVVQAQIDQARAAGAEILTGGTVETLDGGLYLRPTVITGVAPEMAVMAEETFGPVIPVTVVDNDDEAVRLANEGPYGLSAAVIAGSVEEAEAIGARLQVGAVSINDGSLTGLVWEAEKTSFGESGLGPSRMGDSGLLRFLRKRVLIRQSGEALPLAAYAERRS